MPDDVDADSLVTYSLKPKRSRPADDNRQLFFRHFILVLLFWYDARYSPSATPNQLRRLSAKSGWPADQASDSSSHRVFYVGGEDSPLTCRQPGWSLGRLVGWPNGRLTGCRCCRPSSSSAAAAAAPKVMAGLRSAEDDACCH